MNTRRAFWGIFCIWQSLSKLEKPQRILIFHERVKTDLSSFEMFCFSTKHHKENPENKERSQENSRTERVKDEWFQVRLPFYYLLVDEESVQLQKAHLIQISIEIVPRLQSPDCFQSPCTMWARSIRNMKRNVHNENVLVSLAFAPAVTGIKTTAS